MRRQEELIREEEAAWLAETEQKMRRGIPDKDKKSKKKQVRHTFMVAPCGNEHMNLENWF